ncbi:FAD-binding oxidoreductase [Vitiosangium sp. GDMCC 1.1324]|uniref:NAD(P)/FAD-dependent oxidoreductase n=1 Tax=Vitiosangium sp. (strain GDMCC 1.1324) TaxID=2138576 RepID=UPI000D3BF5EF|nr:FAD-dependent oxidoreductase [Vitiosangium sp. GDMCC 1.1324]PTL78447.1 D-amino-acid oxidase [Vitiosangium sp. GDMCC 1.1324]
MSAFDCVIVGGGIVGAALADSLSREGMSVALVEACSIGGGTTACGMGHLVAMDDNPAELALTGYSVALWRELAGHLPPEVEYDACGTLWLAADAEELAAVATKAANYRAAGLRAEVLDASALYEAEPALAPGLVGALRVPGDAVLYPPLAARTFALRAQSRGALLLSGSPVRTLREGSVLLANGDVLASGCIVLAAGVASPSLCPELPISPRKGHLLITRRGAPVVHHQLVELGYLKSAHGTEGASVAFNAQPRTTGQLLLGSSRQPGVASREVEASILERMLQRAELFLPGLKDLQALRIWTGLRPATPDGLPLLGPHPAKPWLWLACGHEGLGITTATGSARLLTDRMLGRASAIPVQPYEPARFLERARTAEALHA